MPKNILQDMRVRDRSGGGETVITITRKDYVPREEIRQEVVEVLDDPVQEIEIPGEIDIDNDDRVPSIHRVYNTPKEVKNISNTDNDEVSVEEDLTPTKKRLLQSILPRSSANRNISSGLPVAENIRMTHDMKRPSLNSENISNDDEDEEVIPKKAPPRAISIPFKFSFKLPPKRILMIIIAVIVLGGFGYWMTSFFEKAIVTITPKNKTLTINSEQFTALRDGSAQGIDFEVMIFSDKEVKSMTLTNSENVSIKAKGELTLFNEFSIKPQSLVAGTYVADGSGKAYKTDSPVTIPGYITRNGKIIPGQINVKITSFLPGEQYNKTTNTFTITGFKKDPVKFKKIYGKLKTALSGGAEGLVYVLSDAEQATLNAYTNTTFKNNVLKKSIAQVPEGYILFPDAISFSPNAEESVISKTPTASVVVSGSVSAVILKQKDLTNAIIKRILPKISANEINQITLTNLSNLQFDFVNRGQVIAKNTSSTPFTLSGKIDAVWNPFLEKLPELLKGISKNKVSSIFISDPGIASASVKIFPPWQSYLPNNSQKIKVELK